MSWWNKIDWTATAAWAQADAALLQAVLSAGAVLLAWWLQKRWLDARDAADRRRKLEGIANSALWVLKAYKRLLSNAKDRRLVEPSEINQAMIVLSALPIAELDDEVLWSVVVELRARFSHAAGAISEIRGRVLTGMEAQDLVTDAHELIWAHEVHVFNAVANVERRVAELNNRPAREDRLRAA
ncbi:MAG TPA: hypothetical protein VFE10_15915 [Phenylobacterium sp.]|jgi:hypothetical protein|nr:hypothetical protein [Phenylobacterium sp.]